MGGRGNFVNANAGNFAFKEGEQTYFTIGSIDDEIIVLERRGTSVKAPEMSHSANRIYAVVQKKELKHIAFYDENHNQVRCIDFGHEHGWNHVKPHVHFNLQHIEEPGTSPSSEDMVLYEKVQNWISKYYGGKDGK